MKPIKPFGVFGRVQVIRSNKAGEVIQSLEFDNAVLDSGLAELFRRWCSSGMSWTAGTTPMNLARYLFLGTGATEPTTGDTGLENRSGTLAGKLQTNNTEAHDWGNTIDFNNDYYDIWYQFRFGYGEGEAEGVWTEVGLGDENYSHPLTRALFRDENGQPISLTILSDEYLTVFYTITFIMEPQDAGEILINGEAISCRFVPEVSQTNTSWYSYFTGFLTTERDGMLKGVTPLLSIHPGVNTSADVVRSWSQGDRYKDAGHSYSDTLSASGTTDFLATAQVTIEPTDNDIALAALAFGFKNSQDSTGLPTGQVVFGYIEFATPATKVADKRLTLDIDISLELHGDPISGLTNTATATTLDFTWDTYPDATEYALVLRQAGTVVATQTVAQPADPSTTPTVTASFTGLTASTEYHLDIRPVATPRSGRRLIYAATTGAA